MKAAKFDYEVPASLDEALASLAENGGKIVSGGQSMGPMLNMRLATPDLLIDLRRLPELTGYSQDGGKLVIGAAVTHAQIEDGALPDATRGMMASVASNIAYRPVRTRGTIGGSLCHADPAADWPSALTALGATLVIAGKGATRRIGIDDFMLGAFATALNEGEVLIAVEVPVLSDAARWGYYKFCRKTGEFAEAICGVVFDPAGNIRRVVLGALGGAPKRLSALENRLGDGPPGDDEIAAAIDALGIAFEPAQRVMHNTAVKRAMQQAFGS
ncbi:MAG: FAD binding domain-containing protein [Alphaproteobacteria bacterium]|nr:FAD binding domain-containing protein [Alphaproteobacteria bacterium]